MTYIIYHIPGVKVGCSCCFDSRKRQYPSDTVFEILEELDSSVGDIIAGDIEWQWAEHFGYNKGHHYSKKNWNTTGANGPESVAKRAKSNTGKKQSPIHNEKNRTSHLGIKHTEEAKFKISETLKHSLAEHFANRSAEQAAAHSEWTKKGWETRKAKKARELLHG